MINRVVVVAVLVVVVMAVMVGVVVVVVAVVVVMVAGDTEGATVKSSVPVVDPGPSPAYPLVTGAAEYVRACIQVSRGRFGAGGGPTVT